MATKFKNNILLFFSLATIILVPTYLYKLNNRFFYIDDKVADYIPKLLDIARILKEGEFPLLSTNFMNGSIYAAEYAEGVFNPVVLLSALFFDSFNNLALGSCVLTICFLLIAFYGFYLLAIEIGIRKSWANIFGISVTLNCFFIYWYTSAWFNPVNGTSFLPYAIWSALVLKRNITTKTITFFTLSCYMVASAGWPPTLLILFGFLLLLLIDILVIQKDRIKFTLNLSIYSATALMCTIPVFPLFLSGEMFTRASNTANGSNFLVGSIQGLLMFAFPAFKDIMHIWGGYIKLPFNNYYTAWYALPLLTVLDFKAVKIWKKHTWILLLLTVVCGLAVLGPERIGSIRFPIRMLHYYHIFGLLLILSLAESYSLILTKKRILILLTLFGIQALFAFQINPENIKMILLYSSALLSLTFVTFHLLNKEDGMDIVAPLVLLGSIAVFVSIYRLDYHGRGADWNVPIIRSDYASLSTGAGYVLYNGGYLSSQEQHHEYRPSTVGLIWNDRTINGYSPLGNQFIREKFYIDDHGNISTCRMKRKGQEFFEIDPGTGLELLELMKVNRVISFKGQLGAGQWRRKNILSYFIIATSLITLGKYLGLIQILKL